MKRFVKNHWPWAACFVIIGLYVWGAFAIDGSETLVRWKETPASEMTIHDVALLGLIFIYLPLCFFRGRK
jgi:hypothetical protein